MQIEIFQGNQVQLPPSSVNVVIDVLRAFTTAHVAFEMGVEEILLCQQVDTALKYKQENPETLLIGEIGGIKIAEFDVGNSPFDLRALVNLPRHVLLKTTNGVEAVFHSLNAPTVLVCGSVNARVTAKYIQSLWQARTTLEKVNIVASCERSDEDLACAEYLQSLILDDHKVTHEDVRKRIYASSAAEKFKNNSDTNFRMEDLVLCSTENDCGFPMILASRNPLILRKVYYE